MSRLKINLYIAMWAVIGALVVFGYFVTVAYTLGVPQSFWPAMGFFGGLFLVTCLTGLILSDSTYELKGYVGSAGLGFFLFAIVCLIAIAVCSCFAFLFVPVPLVCFINTLLHMAALMLVLAGNAGSEQR